MPSFFYGFILLALCMSGSHKTLAEAPHEISDKTLKVTEPAQVLTHAQFSHPLATLNTVVRQGHGRDYVVFIHGTPGDSWAFLEYLKEDWLLANAREIIAVDRPGWGHSTLTSATQETLSLAQQSRILGDYFASLKVRDPNARIIVVGHSLGGSLLARLMGDYPKTVDAGLILAGTVAPELAAPRWYHYLAETRVVNWLIGNNMAKANQEMLMLPHDVIAAEANYSRITQPLTLIQGQKDKLVSYRNLAYASTRWPYAEQVLLPKSGHFLPWQQQALIVAHILKLQASLSNPKQQAQNQP